MREATICKIEGDDEFYHLEPAPSRIMGNDDSGYSSPFISRMPGICAVIMILYGLLS